MKKRKIAKIIIIFALAVMLAIPMLAAAFVLWWLHDAPRDFSADVVFIVETVEDVHPIFIMEGLLPYYYDQRRTEFLAAAARPMTREDFSLEMMRYFATLRDGHMMGGFHARQFGNMHLPLIPAPILNVDFIAADSRLFLADAPYIEVLEIGGIITADVLHQIDRYFFSENESDTRFNHGFYVRNQALLQRAGVHAYPRFWNTYVDLTISDDGEISTMPIRFSYDWVISQIIASNYIVRYEMMDDVMYIRLRTFVDGNDVAETAKAIQQARANGTRNFIVDLRGNGGGNSAAGQRLLRAMGMILPSFGVMRRTSDLAMEQRGAFTAIAQPNTTSQNLQNAFVVVLTDIYTYSSATMMASWVQDGGLGTVVGEPSRNSPSSFGDMLVATLPDSGLSFAISYSKLLRPDANADQSTLWPDIMVPAEDALEAALEFLQNME